MTKISIEFLIPQSEKNSFCNNKDAFIHILQADSNIKISKSTITYNSKQFPFNVAILKAAEKKHLCFHLTVNSEIDALDDFIKLKRLLLKNLNKIFDSPLEVLWDDIDKHYSTIAYPLIKDIENLMRKFLTEFLLINVGAAWIDSSVSNQIKQKADKKTENNNSTFFSSLDFIDLAEFLFEKYTNHNQQIIYAAIHEATTTEDISKIKEMLPRSNWERYFKDALNCEEKLISDNWKKLYILRCKVAHNSSFSKTELEQLKILISKMEPIIIKAIESLKNIHIPESEKSIILEIDIAQENNESELSILPQTFDEDALIDFAEMEYQSHMRNAMNDSVKSQVAKIPTNPFLITDSQILALQRSRQVNELAAQHKLLATDMYRHEILSKHHIYNKNISNIRKEYELINDRTRINPELFDMRKQVANYADYLKHYHLFDSKPNSSSLEPVDQSNIQIDDENIEPSTNLVKDNSTSTLPLSKTSKTKKKTGDTDEHDS